LDLGGLKGIASKKPQKGKEVLDLFFKVLKAK
jgi:hypothetical protein